MAQTIYALASASGRAGVAVVRISGEGAKEVLKALGVDTPKPRYALLTNLKNPKDDSLLDSALVLYFNADKSVYLKCVYFKCDEYLFIEKGDNFGNNIHQDMIHELSAFEILDLINEEVILPWFVELNHQNIIIIRVNSIKEDQKFKISI